MNEDEEKAARQRELLQPPPRRFVKPSEASSSAGAAAGTNWRSTSDQNLRSRSEFFGNYQRGGRDSYHYSKHQQNSNSEPLQRRPNSNNYGYRRPNITPSAPFSELLLEVQHEEANKVISKYPLQFWNIDFIKCDKVNNVERIL
jgi:hypothetical protein